MFTLNDTVTRINQILNYPSITYTDISHFFDQAISELNSALRIGLPLMSELVESHKFHIENLPNVVMFDSTPSGAVPEWTEDSPNTDLVYSERSRNVFHMYDKVAEEWKEYPEIYGVYITATYNRIIYKTTWFAISSAMWTPVDEKRLNDFDLNEILPNDWIILFLIPYVCTKVAARDGTDTSGYFDDYIQGFQQLQTSYNVPNFVKLADVAHLPAYSTDVKKALCTPDCLNIELPTKAIYETMKIGNSAQALHDSFYFEKGWDV